MPYSFIFPSISHLPPGYACTIPLLAKPLSERLIDGSGTVVSSIRVYYEGQMQAEHEEKLVFKAGRLVGPPPAPFVWADAGDAWNGNSGYLELGIYSADGSPIFSDKAVIGFYSIYTKPGKRSFFSDNAYKYGSPPIIGQIAAFGRFVDGYPVVHLDRGRDLGQSLVLINPYKKTVSANIVTHDHRALPRIKVPAESVRVMRLIDLLSDAEASWAGQIQLSATNRLVTYVMMHSLRDPRIISDHEHLDPFRSDPTHVPAFQLLRQKVGGALSGWGFTR